MSDYHINHLLQWSQNNGHATSDEFHKLRPTMARILVTDADNYRTQDGHYDWSKLHEAARLVDHRTRGDAVGEHSERLERDLKAQDAKARHNRQAQELTSAAPHVHLDRMHGESVRDTIRNSLKHLKEGE